MIVTGTHINVFHVCKRELWLLLNGICMEHTSDLVYEGKMLHEKSYPERREPYKEFEIGGSIIDYYDPEQKVVYEIKKSDSLPMPYRWQLKYYLWLFEQAGVEGVHGVLSYPLERKTECVDLEAKDRDYLKEVIEQIEKLKEERCPSVLNESHCRLCSYYDFCYIDEVEE